MTIGQGTPIKAVRKSDGAIFWWTGLPGRDHVSPDRTAAYEDTSLEAAKNKAYILNRLRGNAAYTFEASP